MYLAYVKDTKNNDMQHLLEIDPVSMESQRKGRQARLAKEQLFLVQKTHGWSMHILAANGEQDLADGNPSTDALWLAKSSAHAGLQPVCSGTGKHLVNA